MKKYGHTSMTAFAAELACIFARRDQRLSSGQRLKLDLRAPSHGLVSGDEDDSEQLALNGNDHVYAPDVTRTPNRPSVMVKNEEHDEQEKPPAYESAPPAWLPKVSTSGDLGMLTDASDLLK